MLYKETTDLEEKIKEFQKERDKDYWVLDAIKDLREAESKLRDLDDISENTGYSKDTEMTLSHWEVAMIVEHRREEVESKLKEREERLKNIYGSDEE